MATFFEHNMIYRHGTYDGNTKPRLNHVVIT